MPLNMTVAAVAQDEDDFAELVLDQEFAADRSGGPDGNRDALHRAASAARASAAKRDAIVGQVLCA